MSNQKNIIGEILWELAQGTFPELLGLAMDIADMIYVAYESNNNYFDPNGDDLIAKGGYTFKLDHSAPNKPKIDNNGSRRRFDFVCTTKPNVNFNFDKQIGAGDEGWYKLKFRIGSYSDLHSKYPKAFR